MKSYLSKWRKRIVLVVMIATTVWSASAQHQLALSAKQSVEHAMKNTAQVRNALLDVQIQQQYNREVTSAALPQLSGSMNYTNYIDIPTNLLPGEFFGQPGTYIPVKFGVKHNANYGVELKQLLFDGQVFVGLKARKTPLTML